MRMLAAIIAAVIVLVGCSSGTDTSTDTTTDKRAKAINEGNVALCNDGNYSNNHDLTATCSGGKGIDEWLATYGECDNGKIVRMAEDACGYGTDLKRLMPTDYEPPPGTAGRKADTSAAGRAKAINEGKVALCNDGNYSNNHDLTATCSGGKGIDEWLATYGECDNGKIVRMAEDACGYGTDLKRLMPTDYEPPTTTTTTTTTTQPPVAPTTAPPPPTPPPTTAPPATAPPPTAPPAPSAYYPNCAAARAAGVAPIYRGEPGYSSKLDRDGDGIACE